MKLNIGYCKDCKHLKKDNYIGFNICMLKTNFDDFDFGKNQLAMASPTGEGQVSELYVLENFGCIEFKPTSKLTTTK